MIRPVIIFALISLLFFGIQAQVPQGISHQAVVRDAQGRLVKNTSIGIKVSIVQEAADGLVVYAETHSAMSNANGLITYIIGNGIPQTGVFAEIDWADGPYFLKTEVDPTGGTNYSIEGITQFHSVPYALHSKTSERITGSISSNLQPPTVAILPATDVQQFLAILNGVVNGEGFLTNVVFEWGTTTSYGNTTEAVQSPVRGSIDVSVTAHLSNLLSGKTYHYRIKASNAVDVVYSEDASFTTEVSIPHITTNPITSITPYTANSGGNITHDGGSPVTARGIVWSTSENPTVHSYGGITNDGTGTGSFVSEMVELSPGITYYVRAYATSDIGTIYGDQRSFTTLGQVPTVSTSSASGTTTTSVALNGFVNPNHLETTVMFEYGLTTEYGSTITATQSPLTGSSNKNVSATVEGLTSGTTYYFRIKAENELGVSYGESQSFKTTITGVTGTVTDSEGNVYNTIGIGHQEWMAENLRYLPEVVGPNIGSVTEPFYYVYGYDGTDVIAAKSTDNYQNYGVLYNWSAVMAGASSSSANPSGVQGVCPPGWHVPSNAEWTQLMNYIVSQGYPNDPYNPNGAGNALKSCRQVGSPLEVICDTSEHPRWDQDDVSGFDHHGFDRFDFAALPGGYRDPQTFSVGDIGGHGSWWSATEDLPVDALRWAMNYYLGDVFYGNSRKSGGFSVRCVRDSD